MEITVLFFAAIADQTGLTKWRQHVPKHTTVADVKQLLQSTFPDAADLLSVSRLAVGQQYVSGNPQLRPGDEIAVIPPVSGG